MAVLIDFGRSLFSVVGLFWLGLIGLTLVLSFKRQKRPAIMAGVGTFGFWLIGSTSLPFHLLASLERPFVREGLADVEPTDAIVVLGGVGAYSEYDAHEFCLSGAFDRVMMGMELALEGKSEALIFGGGGGYRGSSGVFSESKALTNWVASVRPDLGVELIALPISDSTADEVRYVKDAIDSKDEGKSVTLVSSAYHLKRSVALFESHGFEVQPVGCDAEGLIRIREGGWLSIAPRMDNFTYFECWFHEIFGRVYYRLRGWL